MEKFKAILGEFFQQDDGGFSAKRLIIIIAILMMGVAFAANLFWGLKIEQFIFDAIRDVVIYGAGITGLEKFVPSFGKKSDE